jgi:hypothetical protein
MTLCLVSMFLMIGIQFLAEVLKIYKGGALELPAVKWLGRLPYIWIQRNDRIHAAGEN